MKLPCNPRSEWKEAFRLVEGGGGEGEGGNNISNENESTDNVAVASCTAKIWLLGDLKRRDYPMRTVPLLVPSRERLEKALSEPFHVTRLFLQRPAPAAGGGGSTADKKKETSSTSSP